MYTTSFIRNALVKGASALAISLVILSGTGCRRNTSTDTNDIQPTTVTEVSTSCTTTRTTQTHTTTTSTTTTTTTTETTTTKIPETTVVQTIVQENIVQTEPYVEPVYVEPIVEQPVVEQTYNELPITDYERTLLRNVVANEYGSDYVSVAEKAKVVAVVMNRVNSASFPNTIEGVLTQPTQFTGYYATDYEWGKVTDSVREAVDYYFSHQDEYGDWLYFNGDGKWNYFR